MKEKMWAKINYFFGLMPVGALFGLLVYVANIEIKDFDLWLHLAVGKFITLHRYVPDVDFLSCSIAGKHWVNHEWLFQVIVYNLYSAFGSAGILRMQIGVVLVTLLLLLFLGDTKNKQLSTSFILLLVYLVYQQRFTIRPDIFSLLFFAIYIFVLALHIDKKWAVPFLCLVQILWSNMHGFFFFGPLFVAMGIVSEWIKRHIKLPYEWNDTGRLTNGEYSRIKITFLFVFLACLVNPSFIEGALYPVRVFFGLSGENKIFFNFIQELQRPISLSTLFVRDQFMYYKLLIFLSAISFVFNRRRIDISALLFWIVFLFFSLRAIRNTVFFAFAAYLVLLTNIISISYKSVIPIKFSDKKFLHLTAIIAKILLVIWIFNYCRGISGRSYYDFDTERYKSEFGGVSLTSYPNKAADFLVENNVKGNFFNDFNSGAYLLGRCFPNIKVFIDGRTEVYGGKYFNTYREIWEDGKKEIFEKVVVEHEITGAFLNASRFHIPTKLLKYLYNHNDWAVVYFNYDAVILLKRVEKNKKLIDRYEIDLEKWRAERHNLYKFGSENILAFHNYYRAYTLESLGFNEASLSEAMEAVKLTPTYSKAYQLIGKIYAKKKDFKNAFRHFRIASVLSPGDKKIKDNLALSYFDLGKYFEASQQYEQMTQMWPTDPKVFFLLAKTYVKDQRYARAMKALQDALSLNPGNYMNIKEIADLAYEQKEYIVAEKMYDIILKTKKDSVDVYKKLGYLHEKLGNIDSSRENFEKSLSLDSKNEVLREELSNFISID